MADAMVFEPSSMSECVQVMKGHVDGFAIALNAMMKFLDNEDDLMLALDVTDQDGGDIKVLSLGHAAIAHVGVKSVYIQCQSKTV